MISIDQRLAQVRAVRTQLHDHGPARLRPIVGDFDRVALPRQDADALRDVLIAEHAQVVIEVGLAATSLLIAESSSIALARLTAEGFEADAAFVDGSHRYHEVFVDLYYLRKLVRPGGLIVLDDAEWPSMATALRYYDVNLGWQREPLAGRLEARRLPLELVEPPFADFKPF